MKKYLFIWVFFFLSGINVCAQKIDLEFDKEGKLLKGMPSVVMPDSIINMKIPFDRMLFVTQIDSIRFRIFNAVVLFENPDHIVIMQKYFRSSELDTFKNELRYFYACLNSPVDDLLSGKIKDTNLKYLPNPKLFIDKLKKQYQVVSTCKDKNCLEQLTITGPVKECENWCFKGQCAVASTDINIEVYKINPVKIFLIDWYNEQLPDFNQYEWKAAMESDDLAQRKLFDFLKQTPVLDKINSPCKALDTLKKLIEDWIASPKYKYVEKNYEKLKEWILSFAWLNNGNLQINPFEFTNPQFYEPNKQPLFNFSEEYKKAELEINKIIALKRQTNIKSYNELITAIAKKDSLENSSRSKTLKVAAYQTKAKVAQENNEQMLNEMQQVGIYMNDIKAPVFNNKVTKTKRDTLHVRNYYYKQQPNKNDFKYLYPDNEKILIAVHNVPKDNNITIEGNIEVYNEKPLITKEGSALLDSLNSIFSLLSPYSGVANEMSGLFTNPKNYDAKSITKAFAADKNAGNKALSKEDCRVILEVTLLAVDNILFKFRLLDSLKRSSQVPPLALNKNKTDTALYSTIVITPEKGESPYKYKYKLTAVTDTVIPQKAIMIVDSSYYNIGKRRLIEFGAGLAYSVTPVRQVNVDTTGGKFNISNNEDRIKLVVGLKFHFKRIFWGDNRFVFEKEKRKDMLDRVYGFLGVSIPKPLDNFYTGAGVDLIPGLSITAGAQWYRYKKYAISNNRVLGQSFVYRPAIFTAITTDPELLVKIFKTIIK
ncbi:MAG: hypothetical protein ABIN74_06125 [Ferruginibacter sp.]